MLFFRARQKPTTKGTAMPGESKASRPLRVVLKKETNLTPCPPPPPHLRLELLAQPQTVSPAKQVREQKATATSKNWEKARENLVEIIISVHAGCSAAYGLCQKMNGKICKNNKGV